MITFTIPGPPVAKARPRHTKKGVTYTPSATRNYEAAGKLIAAAAMRGRPLLTGAVAVDVMVVRPVPKHWCAGAKYDALSGRDWPKTKPDIDNYQKSAFDCLNGTVLADDALIVSVTAHKVFGAAPQMVVTVRPKVAEAAS